MNHRRSVFALVLVCSLLLGCEDPSLRPARSIGTSAAERVRVVFTGDLSHGENYLQAAESAGAENVLETRGYDYCLEKVAPLLRDADLVVANLETPVTNVRESPLKGKKYYIHWTDPVLAPASFNRHNIGAVSLANNHGFDYGVEGLRQTISSLDSAGIVWFGAGMNEADAARPFVHDVAVGGRSVRVVVVGGFEYARHYERAYHFFARADTAGVNKWTAESAAAQIRAARAANPDGFIVAFPHWGDNYRWAMKRQRETARAVIDAGADLIIGHGGHVLEEVERYRGRWIVYGLGDFVFNGPGFHREKKKDPLSLVAALDFIEENGEVVMLLRLYPLFTDSLVAHYQPYLVSERQFELVQGLLLRHGAIPRHLREGMGVGQDSLGRFFEVNVTPDKSID